MIVMKSDGVVIHGPNVGEWRDPTHTNAVSRIPPENRLWLTGDGENMPIALSSKLQSYDDVIKALKGFLPDEAIVLITVDF